MLNLKEIAKATGGVLVTAGSKKTDITKTIDSLIMHHLLKTVKIPEHIDALELTDMWDTGIGSLGIININMRIALTDSHTFRGTNEFHLSTSVKNNKYQLILSTSNSRAELFSEASSFFSLDRIPVLISKMLKTLADASIVTTK